MKKLLNRCGFRRVHMCRYACGALCMAMLFLIAVTARADVQKGIDECTKIEDSAKRIQCYDALAGRKPTPSEPTASTPSVAKSDTKAALSEPTSTVASVTKTDTPTYLERLWELDKESRRGRFAISPHRSNYILPITYVESPNEKPIREDDPRRELKNPEVAFQISFKAKLWQDVFGQNMDLWVAYTQRSFWQLYNYADSSPFRETNYEPEILLNFRTDYDLIWLKNRFINVGFNHQSNGQTEPLSRSWNRLVANFGFERDNLALILKTWIRFTENEKYDDNPNIEDYLGYGELWTYYFWKGNKFGLMLRNNFDFSTNRGALQVEWAFPLFERVGGYIQYFNGYGESMLDYNHHINRIGIGFIIKDWD
jgi:phospholipase A1